MRHVLTCSEAWEVYATLMLDRRVTTQWRGWSCSSHLSFGLLGEIYIYIFVWWPQASGVVSAGSTK